MITRILKITIAIFAILLLGIIGGFATTVMAETPSFDEGMNIDLSDNNDIVFYPEGIKIGEDDIVEHNGPYILFGDGTKPPIFKNETNEAVTYDIVLHDMLIWASNYGITMDTGVNINLYVYGLSELVSSVYFFNINDTGNGLKSSVNLILQDGAQLIIQSTAKTRIADERIEITLEQGDYNGGQDGSAIGMVHHAMITNGELIEHNMGYDPYDDTHCQLYCTEECSFINASVPHQIGYIQLNGAFHLYGCEKCGYGSEEEHTFVKAPVSGAEHTQRCEKCFLTLANESHNFVDNVCTECNAEIVMLHTDENNKETLFIDFQTAISHANTFGGVLKLLRDLDAGITPMNCYNVDYTFDLNGYILDGVYLFIGSSNYEGTLTLTDSSENKTGCLASCGVTNMAYGGTIIIDGADAETTVVASGENASIIIKNVHTETMDIELYDGKFQIIDSEFTVRLDISAYEVSENSISIANCTFGTIALYNAPAGYSLTDTLAEGYAFYADGGFINSNIHLLNDVTVALHTHNFESAEYTSLNGYHIKACVCGASDETGEKELHDINEYGSCSVCNYIMVAKTEIDGEVFYHSDMDDAFSTLFSSGKNGKITLLGDGTAYNHLISDTDKNYILDLNGHNITVIVCIEVSDGSVLTVQDTSENQSGCIYAEYSSFTAIFVYGELIFNSGEICGVIEAYSHGGEYIAKVTANNGIFSGAVSFVLYDDTVLNILGGTFTKGGLITFIGSNPDTAEINIRGGVFENGIEIDERNNSIIISSLIPSDQCEICFVDEKGNKVELDADDYDYYGYLRIKHKDEKSNASSEYHTLYCDTCSLSYASGKHSNYSYIPDQNSSDTHKTVCGICKYELATEEHSGGKATCVAQAKCRYCEAEYGQIDDVNGHKGGNATCINKAVCELCQKEYGSLNSSKHNSDETVFVQNKDDDTKHDLIYACCKAIINTGSHENGVANCTDKAVCTECSLEYGSEPQGHKYDNNCDASCNVCNQNREISGHKYDNICDTECNECKTTREVTHQYGLDGVCMVCKSTTTPSPQPKSGMSTGAVIGTVLATIVVFGGGAFSLIWFVLRKKF